MAFLNLKTWREDLFGGLNASLVALPLAMAFGVESGLGATSGIIAAIIISLVGSWIAGTPWLISGPTAPMTVVSSLIIARELEQAADPGAALPTIFVIFLLAGFFQLMLGLLRFGDYIRFVPYPLVSGFMSGVGIMMVLFQLFPLMGHPSTLHISDILTNLPTIISQINFAAFGVGLFTILIVYFFPAKQRTISSSLISIVVASVVAWFWLPQVPTIGDISDQWIDWRLHHFLSFNRTQWNDVLTPAITLAILGSIDTLLTCLVADMMVIKSIDHNRQLIGQGVGNMFSALAGGLPGAGATLRTVLNIRAGSKTFFSTIVHCLILLLALFENSITNHIPLAVVAGILITTGISIIDYQGIRSLRQIPRSDAIIMFSVMFITIFVGLLQAFAAGIILASLFFVKQMADRNSSKREPILLLPDQENEATGLNPALLSREVYIQEFSGPLFFGFASHLKEAIPVLLHTRAVIFRMEKVPFIDQSGLYALKDIFQKLHQRKIIIILTGIPEEPKEQLRRLKIVPDIVEEQFLFNTFSAGADWLMNYLTENPGTSIRKNTFSRLEFDKLKNRMN